MLKTNVEFKAYCSKPLDAIVADCERVGARLVKTVDQVDSYYFSRYGRIKMRTNAQEQSFLVFYDRSDVPAARESDYQIAALEGSNDVGSVLRSALGTRCVVEKVRHVYSLGPALINVDSVASLGHFIEVEVQVDQCETESEAYNCAEAILNNFGLSFADIVPWSYGDMQVMFEAGAHWRIELQSRARHGTLFVLDGASGTGKSTLAKEAVHQEGPRLDLVPRYSTRQPRADDHHRSEYVFVTHDAFRDLALRGGFIEYRDFQFGMSYGLPWAEAITPLLGGHNALAIINLGNIRHVKLVFPEAVTILIDADESTIRKRLIERGVNTEEQIAERLANARRVDAYRGYYDFVIDNVDGHLARSLKTLRTILADVSADRSARTTE